MPKQLSLLSDKDLSFKTSPEKWSKKEILGHLIDSAANNHQRFIRTQFEKPTIYYEQNHWVSLQEYQLEDLEILISLWEMYNRHLAHVIKHIAPQNLSRTSIGRDGKESTLQFLAEDYLNHLEHHLNQIL